jgi:hypothetical protein
VANFLNSPVWGCSANAPLCCKKCIRPQHACEGIRRLIGKISREFALKRIASPPAVVQIPPEEQQKFDTKRDAMFAAPPTALFGL